jgi:LPXTG-motif cell wall-anchored protein
MPKVRSSTLVFALAYVVFVVGVFLALGGAAYAADGLPTSASDQYPPPPQQVPIVEVTNPAGPTDTGKEGPGVTQAPVVEDAAVTGPAGPTDVGAEVADVAQALPVTGQSLLATAVLGGALIALGVALRRREHRKGSSS